MSLHDLDYLIIGEEVMGMLFPLSNSFRQFKSNDDVMDMKKATYSSLAASKEQGNPDINNA